LPKWLGGDLTKESSMKGLPLYTCAALIAGALSAPAFAASDTNQNTTGSTPSAGAAASTAATPAPEGTTGGAAQGAMTGQNGGGMHVAQKMRDDLSKAGFTDIHIMPSSFLVRAKDSAGNPVMMVINPDSVTAITEENAASNSNRNSSAASPAPKASGGAQTGTSGSGQTKP
jgi:hypothetical protein